MEHRMLLISVAILLIACFVSLVGCSSIFKKGETEVIRIERPDTQTQVTVIDGDNTSTYTVDYGTIPNIKQNTKSGYYFDGAYDNKDGGTKYFDHNGCSVMTWKRGNPRVFYVRYAPISQLHYKSTTLNYSNVVDKRISLPMSDRFVNAIEGNKDKNVKIKVNFFADTLFTAYMFAIVDAEGASAETLADDSVANLESKQNASFEFVVSSRCLRSGNLYCNISCVNATSVLGGGTITDLVIEIDFEV